MNTKAKTNWMDEQRQRNTEWQNFIATLMTLMFVASVFYGCGVDEGKRQSIYIGSRVEQLSE